jgi:26S proteasome regulatory subunit N12
MSLAAAKKLFTSFKQAYGKGDVAAAESILLQLKLKLIELPGLPPLFEDCPTRADALALARDVLEQAVLLSVHSSDDAGFERNFNQLRTYYTDAREYIQPSGDHRRPQESTIIGLNLLRLLVQNRTAEFHTEIELLSPELYNSDSVKPVLQLEQWLMEGAFNKVLTAQQLLKSTEQRKLVQQLSETVRDEIASCTEKAYERLSIADAKQVLMFDSESALLKYTADRGWQTEDGVFVFSQGDHLRKDLPSHDIINNVLVYAKELERIV